MMRWQVALDTGPTDRCYLGRNRYLMEYLKRTERLVESGADIYYGQASKWDSEQAPESFKIAQSLTYVSADLVEQKLLPQRTLDWVTRTVKEADLLITHYPVHRDAVVAFGFSEDRIRIVNPAPMGMGTKTGEPPDRPYAVGFAGQPIMLKRSQWAYTAALYADAEFIAAYDYLHDVMPMFYDSLGVLAVPSVAESAGVVVLEAIARGVPVVVTENVGAREEIERTKAGIVCADDESEFIQAVGDVLADPQYAINAWNAKLKTIEEWAEELVSTCESVAAMKG